MDCKAWVTRIMKRLTANIQVRGVETRGFELGKNKENSNSNEKN